MKTNITSCKLALVAALFLLLAIPARAAGADAAAQLRGVHRIVFLGDSITQAGDYVADFECGLLARGIEVEVLNLGLGSETVSDLTPAENAEHLKKHGFGRPFVSERLGRVLAATKPDWLFACYGMNDGSSLPSDSTGDRRFAEAVTKLRQAAAAAGVKRIVICTPPVFDGQGKADDNLTRYTAWLLSKRAEGWEVVDLHTPMRQALDARRVKDPAFKFAKDGVHPGREGHWLMAREILKQCFDAKLDEVASAEDLFAASGSEIRKLVQERMKLRFSLWMTQIGHQRPGVAGAPGVKPGLPLAEADAKALEITKQIKVAMHAASAHAKDSLPALKDGIAPQSFEEMWAGFDPHAEPLDVEVLKEWEEDGVVLKVLRYRIGVFKGQKAMMAAVYGCPKGGSKLPGLVQMHGGGQYAQYHAPLANAKRGYATISIAWAGRIAAPNHQVNPDVVKLFWEGKTNDPNYRLTTDWGALDGYHAPTRNSENDWNGVAPAAWTLDAVESPRNSPWFLCTLAARRALTFLERQPEVDASRLGVYGHSMGGKLSVMTAAADARVKAAAPSCGGMSDRSSASPLYRATIGDDVSLRRVTCPIMFQSPANDFHGRINDLQTSVKEIKSTDWRVTCSAHFNHQDNAEGEVATQLWFDQVLMKTFATPKTPATSLDLKTPSGVPSFTVKPDAAAPVQSVDIFYTQQGQMDGQKDDTKNTINRFWHHATATRRGDMWTAELPVFSTDRPLWVYANVSYPLEKPVSGVGYYYRAYTATNFNLSSLLHVATAAELKAAGVKATLQPSLVIETFAGDWQKEWFTYKPENWARNTHKLYDPQWRAPASAKLALDVRATQPNKLVVGLDEFAAEVSLAGGVEWQGVVLSPADFCDAEGNTLAGWSGLKELRLGAQETLRPKKDGAKPVVLGGDWKGDAPEFRNLRWEAGGDSNQPAALSAVAAPKPTRPNIIVILTDDQGYGDFSCHGNPILKTPQLDRLHNEGVRFTAFHVSPTCSPTRSALLSGRHEFKNGVTHTILERERMSLATVTLAQVLQSAGYTTGIFGKWHLGDEAAYQPGRRGFDEVFIHGGGGIGQTFPGSCGDVPGNKYFDPIIKHNGRFEKTSGFCTDVFTGQALKWIESVKGEKPFFCYIPFNAAHAPLSCPPQFKQPYEGRVPDKVATFYGMIANIDANVGRLMAKLNEWGLATNTLIVFMNDNGGDAMTSKIYNAGMRGSKATAWEGGKRAASFWRWPGTLKPASVEQLTSVVDLFPTFAEMAEATLDAKVKAQVEGRSLMPLLKSAQATWPDRNLITHVGRWGGMSPGAAPEKFIKDGCAIRNSRFSLVRGATDWQLFDLQNDPGQTNNIAARQPEVVRQLSAAYDQWWAEVLPCLVNEDAYKTAPKVNPFKEEYWKQFGGGAKPGNK